MTQQFKPQRLKWNELPLPARSLSKQNQLHSPTFCSKHSKQDRIRDYSLFALKQQSLSSIRNKLHKLWGKCRNNNRDLTKISRNIHDLD